eukprot:scaffold24311_cov78-Skeletonema_dohrnii-CCMP3373.AAC.1
MLYPKSALRSSDAVVQGPIVVTDEFYSASVAVNSSSALRCCWKCSCRGNSNHLHNILGSLPVRKLERATRSIQHQWRSALLRRWKSAGKCRAFTVCNLNSSAQRFWVIGNLCERLDFGMIWVIVTCVVGNSNLVWKGMTSAPCRVLSVKVITLHKTTGDPS